METQSNSRPLHELIGSLAFDIAERLSPGDIAALRRLDPADPPPPAFWKVSAANPEIERAITQTGEDAERRWMVILNALAILQGLHRPGMRTGRALADAGIKELRFLKLVRSRGTILAGSVRTVARALASVAQPIDLTGLAYLVLTDGREREEDARRQISRDYYTATYHKEKELEEVSQ